MFQAISTTQQVFHSVSLNRIVPLKLLPALFVLMCLSPSTMAIAETSQRAPNILFILIDDMSWADLGCYGNRFHETPHIDKLATEGMRFTDFYAAGAVCSPTRASIQSGQYQARLGITDFIPGHHRPFAPLLVPTVTPNLPLEIVTPAEALQRKGYKTGYFGKWHLGSPQYEPNLQGYEVSIVTSGSHFAPGFRTNPDIDVPSGTYLGDFLTEQTINFMRSHREQSFFATLSHFAVHIPLEAKEELVEKYKAKTQPEQGVNNPIYAAMVEHVDQSVARLLEALRDLDLEQNTLVVLTSDNGGLYQSASRGGPIVCSNAPLRDEKGTLYEGGIRVPLIVRWPGHVPAGTTCSEPTISTDFWPTFAAVAGVEPFEHQKLDGLSLVPVLHDPLAKLARDDLYFHFPHYHHARPAGAIRSGRWKLIESFEDGKIELYDLQNDLSEAHDLLLAPPAPTGITPQQRAAELSRRLALWRKNVAAQMPTPNPNHDPDRELEIVRPGRRGRN